MTEMTIFKSRNIIILLVALLIAAVGIALFFYQKATAAKPTNPADEMAAIVLRVGKLMVLPADETPTLATVSDPEKLKGQKFFENAKEGDKVLIYSRSAKAILYDPVANKIVEVAPINLGAQ